MNTFQLKGYTDLFKCPLCNKECEIKELDINDFEALICQSNCMSPLNYDIIFHKKVLRIISFRNEKTSLSISFTRNSIELTDDTNGYAFFSTPLFNFDVNILKISFDDFINNLMVFS